MHACMYVLEILDFIFIWGLCVGVWGAFLKGALISYSGSYIFNFVLFGELLMCVYVCWASGNFLKLRLVFIFKPCLFHRFLCDNCEMYCEHAHL